VERSFSVSFRFLALPWFAFICLDFRINFDRTLFVSSKSEKFGFDALEELQPSRCPSQGGAFGFGGQSFQKEFRLSSLREISVFFAGNSKH
jgi:hypothetical protein